MAELKFEITERIGVLSENAKGWTKELNKVSWNEREPKYDLTEWARVSLLLTKKWKLSRLFSTARR